MDKKKMKAKVIIIVGAGAAGIFAAINAAIKNPACEIIVLEKTSKLLAKVKISGGGRCNVTNACTEPRELIKNYPRSSKKLVDAFLRFGTVDTVKWFEQRGVKLKAESDSRMFPVTNTSQTIIDCLLEECVKYKVKIICNKAVKTIEKMGESFNLHCADGEVFICDKLLIATGGSNKKEAYNWLESLGHSIQNPVPSLFTFNLVDKAITELSGVAVADAVVKIAGTKLEQKGPVLITHWGLSGPAVLKLSAWGARVLHDKNYEYLVLVNWLSDMKENQLREFLENYKAENPTKKVLGKAPFPLPKRLWEFLVLKTELKPDTRWNNFTGKKYNRLIRNLVCDEYAASGKTTFKEEFVSCGGIELSEIDMQSMESRICPNLYFAGEVLDIDGVTGGFNFQAAWTTGYLAAEAMAE